MSINTYIRVHDSSEYNICIYKNDCENNHARLPQWYVVLIAWTNMCVYARYMYILNHGINLSFHTIPYNHFFMTKNVAYSVPASQLYTSALGVFPMLFSLQHRTPHFFHFILALVIFERQGFVWNLGCVV